jgi:hypothetical protein
LIKKKREKKDEKCGTNFFVELFIASRIVGWLYFLKLQFNKKKKKWDNKHPLSYSQHQK